MKNRTFHIAVVILLVLAFSSFANPQTVRAATTWTVTSLGDGAANAANCNGPDCRLRDAIAAALVGDTIDFAVTGTINLTAGQLSISKSLAINGPGADLLTIDAGGASRVISVTGNVTVALKGMTLTGGNNQTPESGSNYWGGGLYVLGVPAQTLVTLDKMVITGNTLSNAAGYNFGGGLYLRDGFFEIRNSEISNNTIVSSSGTTQGAGIYFRGGSLLIVNSTISGNTAGAEVGSGEGGGLHISTGGTATLVHVTIAGNSAGDVAGGIYVHPDAVGVNVQKLLLADNSAGDHAPDCLTDTVPLTSLDYNLIENTSYCTIEGTTTHDISGTDPLLGSLADNGGTTRTMALLEGSPAIDAGGDIACNTADQRGIPRPQGYHCDIGAYEYFVPCYVDKNASGAGNGHSWEDAYTDLQSALAVSACYQTWVASAFYYPTSGSDRTISFNILPGAQVYGGFDGTETALDERDPAAHVTWLSGDIGAGGTQTDNSYHVVTMNGNGGSIVTDTTVLDGFTITAGYANGAGNEGRGGGLLCNGLGAVDHDCSPTLHQLNFVANYAMIGGGGVSNSGGFQGRSSPTFTEVTFANNTAGIWGGAVYNDGSYGGLSSPTLIDVTFLENNVLGTGGGAIANIGTDGGNSSPVLGNVTIAGNSGPKGGAIYNDAFTDGTSSPKLANVTVFDNSAQSGGAIYSSAADGGTSAATLDNVILWGNTAYVEGPEIWLADGASSTLNNSLVQGGCDSIAGAICGTGNLDSDPMLGDLRFNGGFTQTMALPPESPAIDAGDDATCAAFPVDGLDQRGLRRPQGPHCDIGAFEWVQPVLPLLRLFPYDGGEACPWEPVGVTLALSDLTRSNDAFDPSKVTLTFNDVDVTRAARVSQTATYPASHATLAYTPTSVSSSGVNSVSFMYPTDGPSVTVEWRYRLALCGIFDVPIPDFLDPIIPLPVSPRDRGTP